MKGIVFTEFISMVEREFSNETVERIIEQSDLPSEGSYTSVGTYDHNEIIQLVTLLSEETKTAVPDLLRTFGMYLFERFVTFYPSFFEGVESSFTFLKGVHNIIHVEVKKLYPDATLPVFEYETPRSECLIMVYRSPRPFGDFAEGLIEGCIKHYGEKITIQRENLSTTPETCIKFILTKEQ